jgi:hypothetical protein
MCEFSSAIPIISLFIAALSLGALAFSGVRYALDRSRQLRQQRFENYHNLLSDLVEGRRGQTVPRLDSQIAVVYEMRNYREDREVSIRILE